MALAGLDIRMPGLTGLQVAQLLKPIDPARLARLVSRLKKKQLTNKTPVVLAQMQALVRQLGAQAEPEGGQS